MGAKPSKNDPVPNFSSLSSSSMRMSSSKTSHSYDEYQYSLQTFKYADDDPLNFSNNLSILKPVTNASVIDLEASPQNLELKLSLSMRLKYPYVKLKSSSATFLPFLITLDVDPINSSYKAPIDLICVIDISGSMAGVKLQLLKETFKYLLELLSENDRLSIVAFNDSSKRITPLLRMTSTNKELTLTEIEKLRPGGGTNITFGMQSALEILKQRRIINSVSSIFLLSDGYDNKAESGVPFVLKKHKVSATFTINSFGYGDNHDAGLMSSISKLKDGNFYFIEKLETVDECFVECLGGLISVVGQDVTIDVKAEPSPLFPDIQIIRAYGVEGAWKQTENSYVTQVSHLISGRKQNYILDIMIPSTSKNVRANQRQIKIASVTCKIKPLMNYGSNDIIKTAELVPTFWNEKEEVKEVEGDPDVVFNYYRVKGAEVMNNARKLSDQGNYKEAKKLLQNIKKEIVKSKLKNYENIQGLIAEIEQAIENVRPEVYNVVGQKKMVENYMSAMQERSNLNGRMQFGNNVQKEMLISTKSRKIG